ncbi:uncharacterized protein LOC106664011 [Cimex lectularius]|uniref:Paramyosin n=1 Tax=Cimex lectularius TaxID=79782 RepID=A0A8I6RET6_CIMLE|nr:uncharacterized protein LOC106664011 [Cimex lectularius]
MKLLIILLVLFFPKENAGARTVTHEDIKEGMISFVHLLRDSIEKLERHENRERQLGEHLRKALSGLDARERAQDGLLRNIINKLSILDERIENLEEKSKIKEETRKGFSDDAMQVLSDKLQTVVDGQEACPTKMDLLETTMKLKIDGLQTLVQEVKTEVSSLSKSVSHLASQQDELVAKDAEAQKDRKSILSELKQKFEFINTIPETSDRDNATINEIVSFRNEMMAKLKEGEAKCESRFDHTAEIVKKQSNAITTSVMSLVNETSRSIENIQAAVTNLGENSKTVQNIESVLVQTSQNVMDTRKRFEYGVHRMLQEVQQVLTTQNVDLNFTVNKEFDEISDVIVNFQKESVGNLSKQFEKEISQVWRQISVMYQQITTSAKVLDMLQNETDHFTIKSEEKFDQLASKLDNIGSNINQIQDNHNFVLGRLSLFVHEFNETRNALASASKYFREMYSHDPVETKAGKFGPGPIFVDDIDKQVDNHV